MYTKNNLPNTKQEAILKRLHWLLRTFLSSQRSGILPETLSVYKCLHQHAHLLPPLTCEPHPHDPAHTRGPVRPPWYRWREVTHKKVCSCFGERNRIQYLHCPIYIYIPESGKVKLTSAQTILERRNIYGGIHSVLTRTTKNYHVPLINREIER